MARRSLNRDRFEMQLKAFAIGSEEYVSLLKASPFRKHRKKVVELIKRASVINALNQISLAETTDEEPVPV